MPSPVTDVQTFMKLTKLASELRVKRIATGAYKGHMKLKLRTPSRLYTLTIRNPAKAKEIVSKVPKELRVVRI